jgi:CobQ-like glutamine amidotransferase family enzyme
LATLTIGHLYPESMNLYGDRGNVLALTRRAEWRGIGVTVRHIGIGDALDTADLDLIFAGGDQDQEQRRVAADLAGEKAEMLREAIGAGLPALVVCGSYQLFGKYYRPAEGPALPGVGIFDLHTEHPGARVQRCIGNVSVDWNGYTLVGFENHGGRTYLGPSARPLATVLHGYGNNGSDGTEGAVQHNAHGTYLHGSLLPKNPALTDHLLRLALIRKYGAFELTELDDSVEHAARSVAILRSKQERRTSPNTGVTHGSR